MSEKQKLEEVGEEEGIKKPHVDAAEDLYDIVWCGHYEEDETNLYAIKAQGNEEAITKMTEFLEYDSEEPSAGEFLTEKSIPESEIEAYITKSEIGWYWPSNWEARELDEEDEEDEEDEDKEDKEDKEDEKKEDEPKRGPKAIFKKITGKIPTEWPDEDTFDNDGLQKHAVLNEYLKNIE